MRKIYTDANQKFILVWEAEDMWKLLPTIKPSVNQSELYAIEYALTVHPGDIEIISDSQLAIRLLNGRYQPRNDDILKAVMAIQQVMDRREGRVTFHWVPRERNKAGIQLEEIMKAIKQGKVENV